MSNRTTILTSHIQLPELGRRSGGRPPAYPLRIMEVGQSFFTPHAKPQTIGTTRIADETGFKFAKRTVTEDGVTGTRCWRVA